MARLPTWAIAALLFLLFVVLPAISPYLGPDEISAESAAASAARDVERIGLLTATTKD